MKRKLKHSPTCRMFALRKIRHEFQIRRTLKDPQEIQNCHAYGLESLELIKRQVLVGNLYKTPQLVIEVDGATKARKATGDHMQQI